MADAALGSIDSKPTRRSFLRTAVSAATALSAGCDEQHEPASAAAQATSNWEPIVAENVADLNENTLRWISQLGHHHVVLQGSDWVDSNRKGYWSEADLADLTHRCRNFGLTLHSLMIPFDWLTASMLGRSERDSDIERIARGVRAAGEVGVRMIEWRWSPDFKWGEEVGYYSVAGRGGADYKAFDHDRVSGRGPFEDLGRIPRDVLWQRLLYFTQPVMAAAEQAGVVMSLHPKDPPVKSMRGIDRLLTNTAEIEAFLDAVPSPANGFTFCQGTVTEMGVDVIDAIRRIGGRGKIHHVHFRAVRGRVPRYVETFIDEGDVDMLAAMRAYKAVNYRGSLVSDHTPGIAGDTGGRIGRTFSHGYIRGLIEAVNAESSG